MKIAHSLAEYAALRSALEGRCPQRCLCAHDGRLARRPSLTDQVGQDTWRRGRRQHLRQPAAIRSGEDYARYPRPLEDDLQVCEADGVDIVLVPSVAEL